MRCSAVHLFESQFLSMWCKRVVKPELSFTFADHAEIFLMDAAYHSICLLTHGVSSHRANTPDMDGKTFINVNSASHLCVQFLGYIISLALFLLQSICRCTHIVLFSFFDLFSWCCPSRNARMRREMQSFWSAFLLKRLPVQPHFLHMLNIFYWCGTQQWKC